MKRAIFVLFALCMILNRKMVTQANNDLMDYSRDNLAVCYAVEISDNYVDLFDDDTDLYDGESEGLSGGLIFLVFLVIYIIQGCVFGFATQKIIENKGHRENWFWWGFFFGFIALIVALSKPERYRPASDEILLHGIAEEARESHIIRAGGWECAFCHRTNDKVVTTCICGKSRDDTDEKIRMQRKAQAAQTQSGKNDGEINTIELLERYKKLLDSGVLTQEEFDAKKKQLLGK